MNAMEPADKKIKASEIESGKTDAQRALQFARSTPGIGEALVGMSSVNHVEENMEVAEFPPAPLGDFVKLFAHEE